MHVHILYTFHSPFGALLFLPTLVHRHGVCHHIHHIAQLAPGTRHHLAPSSTTTLVAKKTFHPK